MQKNLLILLTFYIVGIATIFSVVCASTKQDQLRLLEFSESNQRWLPRSKIDQLRQHQVNFFDITDSNFPTPIPPSDDDDMDDYNFPNQPAQKPYVRSLFSQVDMNRVKESIEHLSSYRTRYYTTETGVETAEWFYDQYQTLLKNNPGYMGNIEIELFNNTFPQSSVIVRMTHEDTKPNDDQLVVILGSHIDSTNFGATFDAPGADDDASGASTVAEVFRVLYFANFMPLPNVRLEFHHYAAEEVGLLGSAAIAESYKQKGVNVVAMTEFDMVGYVGEDNVVGIVEDNTGENINDFIRQLVGAYLDIEWSNTKCGYACSDHASWYRVGYKQSAFPFEAPFGEHNPYIHTVNDTLDKLSLNHMKEWVKLGLGYCIELGLHNTSK